MTYARINDAARFWSKVRKTSTCWLWTDSTSSGYGTFWFGPDRIRAHRWAYEALVGPIPDGLDLDHLCRVRHCVNPSHLEPVTRRENTLRGNSPSVVTRRLGICKRGHALTPENMAPSGPRKRTCRTCRQLSDQKRRRRQSAHPVACPICGAAQTSHMSRHMADTHPAATPERVA